MPVRVLDYSALTEPVARADVAAWRTQARSSGLLWAGGGTGLGSKIVGVLVGLIFVFVFGGVLASFITAGIRDGDLVGLLLPLGFVAVFVLVGLSAVRSRLTSGRQWERWMRLDRFARANGMSFRPLDLPPAYPGEIFNRGHDARVLSHLVSGGSAAAAVGNAAGNVDGSVDGHFLDMGTYRYITGSGKNQSTHNWGFLAIALDRRMPNIVLDSKANNTLFGSNLPNVLDRKQILHLEGDFDEHFTLYCPQQYERDALYIFTPDLMALLIDTTSPFDVELVDQWMFVYSSHPFDLSDPAVLQRLFTIADTVGAKALSQTEHYADDRIGDPAVNIVAPQGARLKRGVSLIGVVLIAAFIAFWGWTFVTDFFQP